MIRRIPTLEITDAAEGRIRDMCKQLAIDDPRDLIDRAIKMLEVCVEVAGATGREVVVSDPTGTQRRSVRIRK